MKKIFYSVSLFLTSIAVMAQSPIVTSADFAVDGDKFYMATDTNTTLGPGTAGANATWDFSSLVANTMDTVIFATPTNPQFPTSNLSLQTATGSEFFFDKSTSQLEALGFFGDPIGVGASLSVALDIPLTVLTFPTELGTAFQDTAFADVVISDIPPDLQAFVDTLRVVRNSTVNSEVDAFGTLTTPLGTFNDVLRQKYEEYTIDSIYIYSQNGFPPFLQPGWSFVDGALAASFGLSNPIITDITVYRFFNPTSKYYLMELTQNASNQTTSIEYQADPDDCCTSVSNKFMDNVDITVYPNPATNVLTFDISGLNNNAEIVVYDLSGRLVNNIPVTNAKTTVDVSSMNGGMFIYRIIEKGTNNIVANGKFSVVK